MLPDTGPYLSYAVLCEKVLRETDDVLSLIRIVDLVTVTVVTPVPASPGFVLPAPLVALTLAIGLKSGDYTGTVPVRVRLEAPSSLDLPDFETSAELHGQERGAAIVLPMQFPAQDEGVYWFVVEVDGEVFTRIPLRIAKNVVEQSVQTQNS
jgi:hypothetical protein